MAGRDLNVALRSLLRRPGLSFGVILTVALGIGATTTVYGVVDGVVLRPLPYERASTLVTVGNILPTADAIDPATGLQDLSPTTSVEYEGIRTRSQSFESLSAIGSLRVVASDENGVESVVPGASVGPGFFAALGVSPALGRTFLDEEFQLPEGLEMNASDVALVSHGYWQRRYGGDPDILGRPLEDRGEGAARATVIGILPENFRPPEAFFTPEEFPDIYEPMRLPAPGSQLRLIRGNLSVVGRLRPAVSLDEARAELARIATEVEAPALPGGRSGGNDRRSFGANDLQDETIGTTARALWVFLGAAGLLLLLAAMNAASLMLARALDRQQELGVRAALGAGRARLVRLLLHEAAILTAAGAVLGVAAAYLGVELFQRYAPDSIPRLATISVDARVLAVAAAVSVATGLAAGLVPALSLTRRGPWDRLREGGRSVASSAHGLRSLLVAGQLALAVVLLAGAGLLFNSFVRLRAADPGFEANGLIAMSSQPTGGIRITMQEVSTLWQRWDPVLEALRGIPGVESAAGASTLPFQAPGWAPRVLLEGDDPETVREGIAGYAVTPGYFETMGTEVRRGRGFEPADGPDGERVVVVNESFVRTQMQGADPLGAVVRRVSEGLGSTGETIPMRVVGVVEDVVQTRVEDGPEPAIYIPYSQGDVAQVAQWLPVVRSTLPASTIGPELRRAMGTLGRLTLELRSMDDRMSTARTTPRFQTLLAGSFGGAAMLLAALGLYGTLAETVRRRRRELGIRMALGADAGTLLGMVTGAGMRLSLVGLGVGLVATLALSRVLRSFLYGVEPYDPLTLAVVTLVLMGVSLLACLAPARKATRVDPATVLQAD
jgi:putative ABC transport system permease protein